MASPLHRPGCIVWGQAMVVAGRRDTPCFPVARECKRRGEALPRPDPATPRVAHRPGCIVWGQAMVVAGRRDTACFPVARECKRRGEALPRPDPATPRAAHRPGCIVWGKAMIVAGRRDTACFPVARECKRRGEALPRPDPATPRVAHHPRGHASSEYASPEHASSAATVGRARLRAALPASANPRQFRFPEPPNRNTDALP